MASSEHPRTDSSASAATARRVAAYVIAGVALLVVVWALIEGGERDLWIRPTALLRPLVMGAATVPGVLA